MIRVLVFLGFVALFALGVAWLADRPGDVAITWSGWRIETSVIVTLAALLVLMTATVFFWSLLRAIVRSPRQAALFWRQRRGRQGYLAIARGLIAVGSGDAGAARRHAIQAGKLVPDEALALLLSAQAAQMSGDRAEAERSFRAMAAREDTKLLGLRGLYVEAQRRSDAGSARSYAEEAARVAPSLPWAGQAVLQFRGAAGDWAGALDLLEANRRSGALDKPTYLRQRAVLLTARALALEEVDREAAKVLVLDAVKLAPDLVPAAALAARFLAEAGETRKATRIIEKAWRSNPHPDLAAAYAGLRLGDSARDRLARVRKLAAMSPEHIEGALAVAAAAIAARDFPAAREALEPFLAQPTQRVALLMAEIERTEHGDEGRAREWMSRALTAARDPAWTADGMISDRWMPMSPVSGRLDAFAWKVPLAEIGAGPAVAENRVRDSAAIAASVLAASEAISENAAEDKEPEVLADVSPSAAPPAESQPALRPARDRNILFKEPIVPILQVPDDPGPDPDPEHEPEPASPSPSTGWRSLFK